jgi:hypothetical protein
VLTQESAAAHVSDLFTKPNAIRRAAARGTLDETLNGLR